jgi:hypothetical protein
MARSRNSMTTIGEFSIGSPVANAGMSDYVLPLVGPNGLSIGGNVHDQVPSHRSASVERFRIHVKGMVHSPEWLHDFSEMGRR